MNIQETINELENIRHALDDTEVGVLDSMKAELNERGLTAKQIAYLKAILSENQAYLNGYSPYDDEYRYRLS